MPELRSVHIMLLASVAAALALVHCDGQPEAPVVPEAVLGRWVTEDARFEGRAFEIRPDTVIFQQAPGQATAHALMALTSEPGARGTVHRFDFRGVSGAMETFEMELAPTGIANLRNRPNVTWTRTR